MALDFTTASLDSRVTVTRALNTATAINSSGFVAVVNANLPRFDYNPVTLACKGLLIEEARTNILTYSAQFENVAWSKLNATVTADATTSPDGTTNADKLVGTAGLANIAVFQSPALTASTAYTETVYAKKAEWSWLALEIRGESIDAVQAWFNLNTGAVGTIVGAGTATITDAGNGWYRCSLTRTTGLTTTSPRVRVYPTNANAAFSTGDGTSGIFAWGAQLEAGAFATSYIPTTTTSLTRNADQVVMTGTNFSDWYNASQSTLMTEASTFSNAATDKFVANINNNGFPNRILMNFTASNNFSASLVSNSVSQVSGTNGVAAALNTPIKMCFATKLDSFAFSQSGVAPTTDNLGVMPVTVDRLWIGSAFTSAFLNGHMRQIKYWPQRLINAETQAFSK